MVGHRLVEALRARDTGGSCRTSDSVIYAVGEVAAIGGRCYGMVGPAAAQLKQAFALDDASCLDDPRYSVPVYQARVTPDNQVEIARVTA